MRTNKDRQLQQQFNDLTSQYQALLQKNQNDLIKIRQKQKTFNETINKMKIQKTQMEEQYKLQIQALQNLLRKQGKGKPEERKQNENEKFQEMEKKLKEKTQKIKEIQKLQTNLKAQNEKLVIENEKMSEKLSQMQILMQENEKVEKKSAQIETDVEGSIVSQFCHTKEINSYVEEIKKKDSQIQNLQGQLNQVNLQVRQFTQTKCKRCSEWQQETLLLKEMIKSTKTMMRVKDMEIERYKNKQK